MTAGSWGIPWRKALAEGALIIASVYIAIVLEGISDHRERVQEARASLEQLAVELREDRADLAQIMAEQEQLNAAYGRVLDWLADPATMPGDSVQDALDVLGYSNRTMFPRRGAWTTMISAGQLAWVEDRALVAHLGTFYERINNRIEYNGRDYDFSLNQVMRETVPEVWDPVARRPARGAEGQVARLRSQLRFMRLTWNQFYLELLREYRLELESLIGQIDAYLDGDAPANRRLSAEGDA